MRVQQIWFNKEETENKRLSNSLKGSQQASTILSAWEEAVSCIASDNLCSYPDVQRLQSVWSWKSYLIPLGLCSIQLYNGRNGSHLTHFLDLLSQSTCTKWLKQQKSIGSQFWVAEAWNPGVGKVCSSDGWEGGSVSCFSLSFQWLGGHHWHALVSVESPQFLPLSPLGGLPGRVSVSKFSLL
jgi:hypothetical protein